ncbi:MBL fold metallo-hydrolase [Bacteroides xylanisolvens]|jgi:hypothetical protein|uniref:MBL fold metallo-hydrolase n=1 Tax=Bacteroides xylanisolvens TaxID=371601 RepID=UPI001CDBF9A1|nr:MBL fold metallo-hydrolase [Bacteroides xylanisolvens]MCA4454498.1 MBL fold metallo-hydrolase [Bacteroides xylanisolvens]MCA4459209.1 MBL fold metallo-hydrolase [Bacteroides xylanisolvens]MCA4472803.1 MBL fold metallo-hydrolase [Bacteroides xylanisolvens]MCA4481952.1 MBL fold metallo-hydrolase [Bacteroides xylanisolvens]
MTILPVNNSIQNSVSYILYSQDVDYCILIDCGEYTVLASEIVRIQKTVKYVFLTHGHFDHICGLNQLIHYYPDCLIFTTDYGHRELRNPRKNLSIFQGKAFTICSYKASFLRGGEQLKFTGFPEIEVIATPGHDASCLSYKVDNALFTGDSYIPGLKVFSKFPSGNKEIAMRSWECLDNLSHNGYDIFCGHHDY